MSNLKYIFLLSIAGFLLVSCAANNQNVNYDATVNFSDYKTFAWLEKTDEVTAQSRINKPQVHQEVRRSIEAGLTHKGLKKIESSKADVLVAYHLSVTATRGSNASLSLGMGRYSSRSSVGVSVGVPIGGRVVEEGTLVIDLLDSKKKSLVWQGIATRRLSSGQLEQSQLKSKIDSTVNEILSNYPPGK
jgi:hypothetical protein